MEIIEKRASQIVLQDYIYWDSQWWWVQSYVALDHESIVHLTVCLVTKDKNSGQITVTKKAHRFSIFPTRRTHPYVED